MDEGFTFSEIAVLYVSKTLKVDGQGMSLVDELMSPNLGGVRDPRRAGSGSWSAARKKNNDPTIAEKFNTYCCSASVKTKEIIREMP